MRRRPAVVSLNNFQSVEALVTPGGSDARLGECPALEGDDPGGAVLPVVPDGGEDIVSHHDERPVRCGEAGGDSGFWPPVINGAVMAQFQNFDDGFAP